MLDRVIKSQEILEKIVPELLTTMRLISDTMKRIDEKIPTPTKRKASADSSVSSLSKSIPVELNYSYRYFYSHKPYSNFLLAREDQYMQSTWH